MLKSIFKLFLLVIVGISIGLGLFAVFSKAPRYTVSISREELVEIGDIILVKYPVWTSEETARKSFSIYPNTEGQTLWSNDQHALIFIPKYGFESGIDYLTKVTLNNPLFAAIAPLNKKYTFAVKNNIDIKADTSVYSAQITTGKYIDINLKTMILTLFENGQMVKTFPIAGKGKPSRGPTPEGHFRVLRKEPKHKSRLSGVWMPWSLNFSSAGYYIHGWPYWPNGEKIKVAYSLGCVRLFDGQDKELYDWADVGTPVIIHSSALAVLSVPEPVVNDGDIVREISDNSVYLIKQVSNKKFKRHVLTADIEKWYSHLAPFNSKLKIVPDGYLKDFAVSRWIKLAQSDSSIYEIDENVQKHETICNNGSQDCFTIWNLYGWDPDEIYTINEKELEFYARGENVVLKPSPNLAK